MTMAKWPWRRTLGQDQGIKKVLDEANGSFQLRVQARSARRLEAGLGTHTSGGAPVRWVMPRHQCHYGNHGIFRSTGSMFFFFFFTTTKPTGGAPPCSDDRKSFKSSFWRKYREVLRKHLYAFGKLNKWHVYLVLQSQHFHSYFSAKMTVSGWLNLDQQPCTVCIYIYTNNTAYYVMVIWHMVMNGDINLMIIWSIYEGFKRIIYVSIYVYIYTHIYT